MPSGFTEANATLDRYNTVYWDKRACRFAYSYDPAGNRLSEQIDDAVVGATYNTVNELLTHTPSGALRVEGTVSEPATVAINGKPATVGADNRFVGSVPLASGTNTISITATDGSANSATEVYNVDSNGATRTFAYDANGNLTADGTRTFEWDARNQLVAVNAGTHRSESTYDGLQRRVRVVEKDNGLSSPTRTWSGVRPESVRSARRTARRSRGGVHAR